jgi:hypothetical protein
VLLVVAWLVPATAVAQPAWTSRAAATVDVRGERGTGTVAGLDLGAVGVGVEWWIVPTLRLRTTALLLGATGTTTTGRSASGGAGGEIGVRLLPFPSWPVRPYARMSAGFLLFLRRPFLPGGDVYDFILGAGAGLEIPLGPRLALFGEVNGTHLSNGQGIGSFNPAFNGFGGLLGASYALSPEAPPAPPEEPELDNPRARWTPGAIAEGAAGWAAQLVVGGRLRVAERLASSLLTMLDAQAASYGGTRYKDVGLALVGQWTHATLGFQATYQHIPGIDAVAEQLQLEAHLSNEVSPFATGIVQQQSVFSGFFVGAAGIRTFPFPSLRIDGGLRLTRSFAAGATVDLGPYVAFEWQVPLRARLAALPVRRAAALERADRRHPPGVEHGGHAPRSRPPKRLDAHSIAFAATDFSDCEPGRRRDACS